MNLLITHKDKIEDVGTYMALQQFGYLSFVNGYFISLSITFALPSPLPSP
jgi:hypothetical protein